MRKPDLEIGGHDSPYMRRWYVIPRNRVFCVYLHNMLRDDDYRALHDHPGANVSIVLRGGYREVMFWYRPRDGHPLPPVWFRKRTPGSIVFRWAKTAHRLELLSSAGSWSLFIVLPKLRNWGFWCPGGRWVRWEDFTTGPDGTLVGRGCD